MIDIDKKFKEFIAEHHVLTLATAVDNIPYVANCFYAYEPETNMFIFTSDDHTKHVQDALENNYVAVSIVLETSIVGKIQGLQMNGIMYAPVGELKKHVNIKYMLKYPFAAVMNTSLWVFEPDFMKLTDNRLGFGTKLNWFGEGTKIEKK
jgi:uncharacterized protein YhbP (UPF0306 family)